jgi:hypothetical protein
MELFVTALLNLSDWYSHHETLVLKLTKMPKGYPDGFTFAEGTTPNTADYFGRGWYYARPSPRMGVGVERPFPARAQPLCACRPHT